ncbi:MAG: autotransporter outer membrane beta-barrel domain-containing protein, partial [Thermodesulfovibrionaceae bacterium]
TLIARADSRNLKLNKNYYLIYNEGGTVNGQWGGLEKGFLNPNFNVSWAGEDLGENSAVMFTYEPQVDYATMPVIGGMATAPISINMLVSILSFSDFLHPFLIASEYKPLIFASSALSDTPLIAPAYSKGVWFMPVYTKMKAGDLGFDADSYGFSFGIGRQLSSNLYGGVFAGYLRNNLDFKVREAKDEDQDLFLGGVGLLYLSKPWYGRLITYAYTAEHDYTGRTGLNYELLETADYKSRGYYAEVTAGYLFGEKIRFAPELGVAYGYYKTKSFRTSVPLNPSLERTYEPDSIDVFKAIAGFSVQGSWNKTQLLAGLRLEQTLGDNDISVIHYLPGQPKYKLEKSIADTTVVIHAGLNYSLSKQISLEIGARADINGDYKAYTGKGMLRIAF